MTRMLGIQGGCFTRLGAFLRDELPQIPTAKPGVWDAFRRTAQLDDATARAAIAPDADPYVFVEDLPGLFGRFDPGRPRTISLAKELAAGLQSDAAGTLERVEATVLHEIVHWSWARARLQEPEEMGERFEALAYGSPEVVEPLRSFVAGAEQEELGTLSRRFESNGNPGAIGRDTNGGWSYGLYQLSARQGTLGRFLRFIGQQPEFSAAAAALEAAGGESAARLGMEAAGGRRGILSCAARLHQSHPLRSVRRQPPGRGHRPELAGAGAA